MKILIVSTGRSGTVSLTKWFNELFEANKINAKAVHEHLAGECYKAVDQVYRTKNPAHLMDIVKKCYNEPYEVIIGNGYQSLLPQLAELDNNIILIHLQRRDKAAWVNSIVKNAEFFPFAHQYYVADELLAECNDSIPRTTAFHVGEESEADWHKRSLSEKFSWFYDYTHNTIAKNENLFAKHLHLFTEDLNDIVQLENLAKFCFPNVTHIPAMPKLNAYHFADIESYPPHLHQYAQWLWGNLDWQKAIDDPSYLALYGLNRLETWISWSRNQRAQALCPEKTLTEEQIDQLLKANLHKIEASLIRLSPFRRRIRRVVKKLIYAPMRLVLKSANG